MRIIIQKYIKITNIVIRIYYVKLGSGCIYLYACDVKVHI